MTVWRRDDGNVSVLTLGWVVAVLLAALVVTAATQVHLDRMRLTALADEVALAAADSLDAITYYGDDSEAPQVWLDVREMEQTVSSRLASPIQDWERDVMIVDVRSEDGVTAQVTLARTVRPLFAAVPLMPWSDGIVLVAESRARAW